MERTIKSKYVGLVYKDDIVIIDTKNYYKLDGRKVHIDKTNKSNYPYISLNRRKTSLANWVMNHNPKDSNGKMTVDHKNRNTQDAREENLRIVDRVAQATNRLDTVIRGLWFYTSKKNGKSHWIATWRENNKDRSKWFSVDLYGYERAYEKAAEYRLIKELFIPAYYDRICLADDNKESFILKDINSNPDIMIIEQKLNPLKNIHYIQEKGRRPRWIARFYNKEKNKWESTSITILNENDDDEIEEGKNKAIQWRQKKIKKYT